MPRAIFPEVRDCAAEYGSTTSELFGAPIPVRGIAGDQQAALVGQACFSPGMIKATYGTGSFAILNTGSNMVASHNRLLSTIAYRLGGETVYGLEGAIFVAGAAVQWLRDGCASSPHPKPARWRHRPIRHRTWCWSRPSSGSARRIGMPRRAARYSASRSPPGRTNSHGPCSKACAFQTLDLLAAMRADYGAAPDVVLRVDGGMAASDWTMQRLADILDAPVDRPVIAETTALGAAYLAGLQSGLYPEPQLFAERWALDRRFTAAMDGGTRARKIAAWRDAVARTLSGQAALKSIGRP